MTNKILYYENVQVEEKLPSFELTINRTHIVKYAGASGDFFPVHHDEEFAKSIGLPSVFAMGLMHGGMLAKLKCAVGECDQTLEMKKEMDDA